MKDSSSWIQCYISYDHLRFVDNMNDSGSLELKPLNAMNNFWMWMIWMILRHELWSRVMDDMNNSSSWAHASRYYEQLKVVIYLKEYGLWAQALNALNSSRLYLIWTILGRELKNLDGLNNFGLWMTWMTLGHELRPLNTMKSLGLWLTQTNPSHELRALDPMNNCGIWLMIRAQLVYLDFGPQTGVINKIYNLLHHMLR